MKKFFVGMFVDENGALFNITEELNERAFERAVELRELLSREPGWIGCRIIRAISLEAAIEALG